MASTAQSTPILDSAKEHRYDIIIVGGGVAGLVAAARLSEDASKRVLVLEAGCDRREDPRIDTPGMLMSLWGDSDYDWDFYSEPQSNVNGRQIPQPRGKVLGGSSAMNVTAIVYPTQRDFDAWTKLGNRGWTYEEMRPYYKKFHTFYPASKKTSEQLSLDSYIDQGHQGTDGPISATFADVYGPFNEAWNAAFKGVGFNDQSDPIFGKKLGAFTPPNSIDPNGNKRSYSASAYFNKDIEARPNLDLMAETYVTRMLLEGSDGSVEAKGVQICDKNGKFREIYAIEVVIAAGAVQSPQILENSGIGSEEILKHFGIDVVINNSGVGENLQDHCFSAISFEVADGQISGDVVRDSAIVRALVKQYQETQTGPLSGLPFSLAYVPPVDIHGRMGPKEVASLAKKHIDVDDPKLSVGLRAQYRSLQDMMLDPAESTCFYGLGPSQMHIQDKGKTSMSYAYSQQLPGNYITIMTGLNHPLSRGSVHIRSNDPKSKPIIDPRYLSHPVDLELLARGTQFIENITDHRAMRKILKTKSRIPPIADFTDLDTAKKITKDKLWTTYHLSCTCPMMPRELGGVVNDRLIVHGTKNVRVIDASILPMIPLGNIQSSVYAVAERACDLIKEDWNNYSTRPGEQVDGFH